MDGTDFCRKSKCDKPASHVLYYFEDGMRYSIRHCEKHLDWAKETMGQFIEANKDLESQESPVEFK